MDHEFLDLEVYIRVDGSSPFYKWLDSVKDKKVKARIYARLDKLAYGHLGDSKFVGDGVFELRLKFGTGYRIYFCLNNRSIIILLFGGDKSSQMKDIEFAKKLLIEFKARSYEK